MNVTSLRPDSAEAPGVSGPTPRPAPAGAELTDQQRLDKINASFKEIMESPELRNRQNAHAIREAIESFFRSEPDQLKKVDPTPQGILDGIKGSKDFKGMHEDYQKLVQDLSERFQQKAQAAASAGPKVDSPDMPNTTLAPSSPSTKGQRGPMAGFADDGAERRYAEFAARQQQGASQQPVQVTMGAAVAHALMNRNKGPGPTAQAVETAAPVMPEQVDRVAPAREDVSGMGKTAAAIAALPANADEITQNSAMRDHAEQTKRTSRSVNDAIRQIMDQVGKGEMREDKAAEILKELGGDIKKAHNAVESSEVGKQNPAFVDAAKEEAEKMQEIIRNMIETLKKGLRAAVDFFAGKSNEQHSGPRMGP